MEENKGVYKGFSYDALKTKFINKKLALSYNNNKLKSNRIFRAWESAYDNGLLPGRPFHNFGALECVALGASKSVTRRSWFWSSEMIIGRESHKYKAISKTFQ